MMEHARSAGTREPADRWSLSSDVRKPLPELIEDKLRSLIDDGTFAEGDRLPTEPELAARMEVARSSLRTALQRLQLQGVVEVMRGRGWYVRSADLASRDEALAAGLLDLHVSDSDLFEVRIALESTAASLAALRADDGELDDIEKRSRAHAAAPFADKDQLLQTDEEFHAAVVRASHNELLEQLYQSLVPQLRSFRRSSYTSPDVHTHSGNSHDQVVWFLKRRDEGGARAAMTTHLLGLYHGLSGQAATTARPRAGLTTYAGQDEPSWQPDPV